MEKIQHTPTWATVEQSKKCVYDYFVFLRRVHFDDSLINAIEQTIKLHKMRFERWWCGSVAAPCRRFRFDACLLDVCRRRRRAHYIHNKRTAYPIISETIRIMHADQHTLKSICFSCIAHIQCGCTKTVSHHILSYIRISIYIYIFVGCSSGSNNDLIWCLTMRCDAYTRSLTRTLAPALTHIIQVH